MICGALATANSRGGQPEPVDSAPSNDVLRPVRAENTFETASVPHSDRTLASRNYLRHHRCEPRQCGRKCCIKLTLSFGSTNVEEADRQNAVGHAGFEAHGSNKGEWVVFR